MAKKMSINIDQKEIDIALQKIAAIRGPQNMPTRKEIEEMIVRMKKRWGAIVS